MQKSYGGHLILSIAELKIYAGDRIGLVGPNGCGKTTLLNLLAGSEAADQGQIRRLTAVAQLSQMEASAQRRISAALARKFGTAAVWSPSLSGGEQTRFKLAAASLPEHCLLLADEPTSNLDIPGIQLAEQLFANHSGAFVLVSHDRSLLNAVCQTIWAVDGKTIRSYEGNYDAYRRQKQHESQRAQREYQQYTNEKQGLLAAASALQQKSQGMKKTPKRMGLSEARLHKMGNQGAKTSLERGRRALTSRLAQLPSKEKPRLQPLIRFDLAETAPLHSKVVVQGRCITKSFGDKVLFDDAHFVLPRGTKTALIGANGCGKTTLLKMIARRDEPIELSPAVKIGYFSQMIDDLDDASSVLDNVIDTSIYSETAARTLLARLLLAGDAVHKPVQVLSGGERAKVSFAKILLADYNLLVVDEPTNFLDIPSLEVLEHAFSHYNRSLLFVSHDRSFIRAVADQIMIIADQKITVYPDTYDRFLAWQEHRQAGTDDGRRQTAAVLKNRLAELMGRLSLLPAGKEKQALDAEYKQVLEQLKQIQAEL